MNHPALRDRAARALDLTHGLDRRGPLTGGCRDALAAWLDTGEYRIKDGARRKTSVLSAVKWLEAVIKIEAAGK